MDESQPMLIPLDQCYFAHWEQDGIPSRYVPIVETPHYRFAQAYLQKRDDDAGLELEETGYGYYVAWESYCVHHDNAEKYMGGAHTEVKFAANIDRWRGESDDGGSFDDASHPIDVRKIGEGMYVIDDGAHRASYSLVVGARYPGEGEDGRGQMINARVRRLLGPGESGWRNWRRSRMNFDVCRRWWQRIPSRIRERFEETRCVVSDPFEGPAVESFRDCRSIGSRRMIA